MVGGEGVKGARDWPEDAHPQYDSGKSRGYNALGHALESATTGSDYGATEPKLDRGGAERAVMKQVMERYGDPELKLMDSQTGIPDSLGRIGAAYVDDLNYGLAGWESDQKDQGLEDLLGAKEKNKMDAITAKQFIRELGANETSHGIMSQAQQAYTTSRIHAHEGSEEAYRAAERGLMTHGALDEARAEQIGRDYKQGDEDYNHELAKSAAWQQTAVSVTVGTATTATETAATILAPAATPALIPIVEAAGSAAETALGNEIDEKTRGMARSGIEHYMDQQGVTGARRDDRIMELNDAYARGQAMTDTDNSR